MKIVIAINTSWNIYNFRKNLVSALIKEGHDVYAVAPNDDFSEKLIALGCQYVPIKMNNKGTNPIQDFLLMLEFRRVYKKINPDVILHYTIKPNIYGTLAAKTLKIPCVNNVSGLGTIFINPNAISSRIGFFLYRLAFRHPKKVFFQNADDQQLFIDKKLVNAQITGVLPGSGVDLNAFKPTQAFSRNKDFTFLLIGRMLYDKGIVEFVDAAKVINSKQVNCKFQLLGQHDNSKGSIQKNWLEEHIKDNTIAYLGVHENVKPAIENADCIVLPSYREGTPKTLLEAAALHKPIIASDVPGCKDVVNGKNGYLCKVKSSSDLINKMESMLSLSNEALEQMGLESRKLAEERFDEKIVIKEYLNLISTLISGIH